LKAERDSLKANARLHVDGEVMRRLSLSSVSSSTELAMHPSNWHTSPRAVNCIHDDRFYDSAEHNYEVDIRGTPHAILRNDGVLDLQEPCALATPVCRPAREFSNEPRIAIHLTDVEAVEVAKLSAPACINVELTPPTAVK